MSGVALISVVDGRCDGCFPYPACEDESATVRFGMSCLGFSLSFSRVLQVNLTTTANETGRT
eukprot:scaffold30503_cov56-Attheya_sp.AAC.2